MNAKGIKSKLTAAFSLIELMVVIAIVALLTAIAVPSYQGYLQQSKVTEIFSLASDQMNQWTANYNTGSSFDLAFPTPGGTITNANLGSYIGTSEVASGTPGTVTNGGTAATGCVAGNTLTGASTAVGVVCIKLATTAAVSGIDPAMSGLLLLFAPIPTGTATGDSTDTSITWKCYFKGSTSSNATQAASLLAPGNCTNTGT